MNICCRGLTASRVNYLTPVCGSFKQCLFCVSDGVVLSVDVRIKDVQRRNVKCLRVLCHASFLVCGVHVEQQVK